MTGFRYESSLLWKATFSKWSVSHPDQCERIRSAYAIFWERGVQLATQISTDLPDLTLHDENHLSALWDRASQLAGPEFNLNPVELFVFGGAILLHDTGHAFAAYIDGLPGLRSTVEYKDILSSILQKQVAGGSLELPSLVASADQDKAAIFRTLRRIHSSQAEKLATRTFGTVFLIDDSDLRSSLAQLIGKIAASHNWERSLLEKRLPIQQGAPGSMPQEWDIRPMMLACLLRCSDAIQIDERRAPLFAMNIHRSDKGSILHWLAQRLAQPICNAENSSPRSITFTSQNDFEVKDADAWWTAHDLIKIADIELHGCQELLQQFGLPPLTADHVSGADTPSRLMNHIRTSGWKPVNAEVRVTSPKQIIELFGGRLLYGSNHAVPIRELIQNASDAVRARRALVNDELYRGFVLVKLSAPDEQGDMALSIRDNGVGMSESVLTGSLVEFGKSFWISDEVQEEFPGLTSMRVRQVGKYGIGFFSFLMLTEKIVVTSRRFNADVEPKTLVFREGIHLRPLLLTADSAKVSQFSTDVTLSITQEIVESLLTFHRRPLHGPSFRVTLPQLIAHLCPCLDCDVWVQQGLEKAVLAHSADWFENDAHSWLRDVTLSDFSISESFKQYISEAAARLRVVYDQDGKASGRAAVAFKIFPAGVFATGGLVIGSMLKGLDHFAQNFVGVVNVEAEGPQRNLATNAAIGSQLQPWLGEQVKILSTEEKSPVLRYISAINICAAGENPGDLAAILLNREIKTVSEIAEILRDGAEVYAPLSVESVNSPPQLTRLHHKVDDAFHQGFPAESLEFKQLTMEAWEHFGMTTKDYHLVRSGESVDKNTFLDCLRQLVEERGHHLLVEHCCDIYFAYYVGKGSERDGLLQGSRVQAAGLRVTSRPKIR